MVKSKSGQLYTAIVVLLLILSVIASIPGVYGRYMLSQSGTVYSFSFSSFGMVSDIFPIINAEGEKSASLWGAANDDDSVSGFDRNYELADLSDVQITAYNATSVHMFITFEFVVCLNPTFISTHDFPFEINNLKYETGTPHFNGNLDLSQGGTAYKYLGFIQYYKYSDEVNPKDDADCDIQKFIIAPGELGEFQLSINDSGNGSCYASIKMTAHPYDENGNLLG